MLSRLGKMSQLSMRRGRGLGGVSGIGETHGHGGAMTSRAQRRA